MQLVVRIAGICLSVLLGCVFIYSGYSKLDPVIETFEFTFVDLGLANWYTAPLIARLMIALEFFTGFLLIICYNHKKLSIPLTISILSFFILYLIGQIIVNDNTGNCGCFGERLYMSPMQAIFKNLVMIIFSVPLLFIHADWKISRPKFILPALIAAASLTIPFLINPVDYSYTSNNMEEKINYPLELNLLFEPLDSEKVEIPKIDLRKGKHVLSFLSLTCSHCRIAAKKFRLIKKENPDLPIYFILNGDKKDLNAFLEDTKATNIPYSFCLGKSFVQLASAHLPRIYFIDDGLVVKKLDYFELNQYQIEDWIKTGKVK